MSTDTDTTTDAPEAAGPVLDFAPSDVRSAPPVLSRALGAAGLCLLTAGVVSVLLVHYGRSGLFGSGGYLMIVLGIAALFIHAVRDDDPEVRRGYGAFAALLLLASAVLSVLPGAPSGGESGVGYYLLPWGAIGWVLALVFAVPFARHEDDPTYLRFAHAALLGVGGLLCAGSVVAGVVRPDTLAGPGFVLALIGVGYLAAYIGSVDTNDGPGYWAAFALGVLGAAAVLYAAGKAILPTVLHEGPRALRTPYGSIDRWAAAGRGVLVFGCLVAAYLGVTRLGRGSGTPGFVLRVAAGLAGLGFAGALLVGSFSAPWTETPGPYLVPYGLLLGGIGLVYLLVSVGALSDAPVVVLTRREVAAYFHSPIAYMVLFGMAFASAIGYAFLIGTLSEGPAREPIVQNYMSFEIVGAFVVVFLVPALTMRLFSEEQRTGTLEVLLTAPVNEPAVVLSKFLAAWLFFLVCWVPAGLYLVALRVAGGPPEGFDYRPLLSFYLALAATGAGFIAMGLFFSSLTRNQVIAAVLTFAGMMGLLMMVLASRLPYAPEGLKAALGRLEFYSLWRQALAGVLPVPEVLVHLSLAGFWLFLTTKVLEVRKWS